MENGARCRQIESGTRNRTCQSPCVSEVRIRGCGKKATNFGNGGTGAADLKLPRRVLRLQLGASNRSRHQKHELPVPLRFRSSHQGGGKKATNFGNRGYWCRRFEAPTAGAATSVGSFKSIAAPETRVASTPAFPKFASGGRQEGNELRKPGVLVPPI